MRKIDPSPTIIENLAVGARRSEIFHWFFCNYAQFLQTASIVRIDWTQLASALADAGLRNTRGQKPTPKLVKITWFRVKQHMARRPHLKDGKAPAPIARLSNDQLSSKTPTARPGPDETGPSLRREASTNRPMPLAPPETTIAVQQAEAEPPDQQSRHAEGQARIDRVLAQLKARSDRRHGIF